ncbi:Uncharacterized phage protein gp47/JayE [Rhodoferax sp. OV413]|uniref:baseplate J/gp47 family protein n=1 Tax=Rhodoferax sp. OV413 TaxID=1855285 RepID=UPI00088A7994|nr:baseplate J/gp47 family protein [Rhodoferax sp. OV413]SDO75909.1 Uncharacterized phage protein gp47/JayE [Rhodoferax sp. OV413]
MPFERPTLPQLIEQGATELESRLPGVLVRVRRSLVGVLNRVFAGSLSALYQYVEWLIRQAWPDTAEKEFLDAHGARWGVTRTAAAKASGSVLFIGTDGKVVPAGTVVQRSDGAQYATFADVTIAAGQATATVTAVVAGQAGNASTGVALALASPIDGVNSSAVATTALAGGAEVEEDEPYRARILAKIRKPPQGGADFDYEGWAKEVPGVTRVWVSPLEPGPGWVTVRFMRDNDPTPIPDAGEVATMFAHIDAVRPVTAHLSVQAPVEVPQNYTIAVTPNTPAVRAAVYDELAAMIYRDAVPAGTILLTHSREAISIAAGENNHVLTFPTADVVLTTGQIATMGVITWL